jgi:putative oxidoreductase
MRGERSRGSGTVMIEDAVRRLRERLADDRWALLPLRLMIGFGFADHGYAKLARGPESFAAILAVLGVPAPGPAAWATSLLELVGGVMLILGAAVAPLCLPLAAIMATAVFGVHARYGFSSVRLQGLSASGAVFGPVGYELNLVYLAGLLTLALSRPGPLSLDGWLEARRSRANGRQDGP